MPIFGHKFTLKQRHESSEYFNSYASLNVSSVSSVAEVSITLVYKKDSLFHT